MPTKDRVAYEAVAPDERPTVIKRLEAVWAASHGGDLAALAKGVGLKRAAFYNLRRAWSANSLIGIIPNAKRWGRTLSVSHDDPIRRKANILLRRLGGDARNVEVARRLLPAVATDDTPHARLIALQKAERIVQHERRNVATDPRYLRKGYGKGVLIELTGVQLLIDDGHPTMAVAAFVMDRSSGFILGASVGVAQDGSSLEIDAITSALAFLRNHRADRRLVGEKPDCVIMLPAALTYAEVDLGPLQRVTGDLITNIRTAYPKGMLTVHIVGPRIGRLGLAPRKDLPIGPGDYPVENKWPRTTVERARAYFEREIYRHNESLLDALKRIGLVDGDGPHEADLSAVLEAARQVIEAGRH